MDWDKLKIFHTVAEASSFTKASTILNLANLLSAGKFNLLKMSLKLNYLKDTQEV